MNLCSSLSLVGLVLGCIVASTGITATQELNPESFAQLTSSSKNGMIKYYQSWCGHCTALKPTWDQLAESVDSSVFIADVNCGDQQEMCEEMEITGYPTIKVFKAGEETSNYSGGRTLDDLLEFVNTELAAKCTVENVKETCSEKAAAYVEKWQAKDVDATKKELSRLQGMINKSMTADLKAWLRERLHILQQLAPTQDEL